METGTSTRRRRPLDGAGAEVDDQGVPRQAFHLQVQRHRRRDLLGPVEDRGDGQPNDLVPAPRDQFAGEPRLDPRPDPPGRPDPQTQLSFGINNGGAAARLRRIDERPGDGLDGAAVGQLHRQFGGAAWRGGAVMGRDAPAQLHGEHDAFRCGSLPALGARAAPEVPMMDVSRNTRTSRHPLRMSP